MKVIYRYFAIKPLRAEHPIGSGTIVEYKPGEEIPANDWGRATDNLVELGKAARVAFNVPDDQEEGVESIEVAIPTIADGTSHVTQPTVASKPRGRPRKRSV